MTSHLLELKYSPSSLPSCTSTVTIVVVVAAAAAIVTKMCLIIGGVKSYTKYKIKTHQN